MPMPSIVWDYFDEFEGGGKCRLCGCIRNRKDKSTSTFWQHLERVHGLDKRQMLINSATNNVPCGKMRPSTDSSNGTDKRSATEANEKQTRKSEPAEKMPKLELMADLDRQATEETFKFISELVKQQSQPSPVSSVPLSVDNNDNEEQELQDKVDDEGPGSKVSMPIGISLNSLEGANDKVIEATSSDVIKIKKKQESAPPPTPAESNKPFLNDYINGLLDIASLSPKNGTSSSSVTPSPPNTHLGLAKAKSPAVEGTPTKKRMDYLSWDEFFMSAAILSAQRSKDPSTQVGACIVKDNIIVGIGYNGMPNGCHDDEMPWGKRDADPLNTKHPYVCHAEMNAILNKNCADIRDCTIYTTMFPCCECAKLIIQSRIKKVIYLKDKEAVEMTASRLLFDKTGTKYSQFEPLRDQIAIKFK